jgi:aspartate/tyrosine/aromatic aminotransferase
MLDEPTMTGTNGGAQFFDALGDVQSDSLLALIAMANADPRPDKIDVGVGVYRDGAGNTPILRAVKAAESCCGRASRARATSALWGQALHGVAAADRAGTPCR